LNTELSAKNKTITLNTWTIPVLTYWFGIIKWIDTDLKGLERLTKRLLTRFCCFHPNSSIIRLYLPEKKKGKA
jgi:hypothetical protein